jgi:hypothetical protein
MRLKNVPLPAAVGVFLALAEYHRGMRDSVERIIFIAIGTGAGGFFGLGCLGALILALVHGYDHGFGEAAKSDLTGAIIGACIGALAAWRYVDRKPP